MTPLERIGWGFIGGRRSSKAILLGHLPRQPASRNVGLSPTAKVLGLSTRLNREDPGLRKGIVPARETQLM